MLSAQINYTDQLQIFISIKQSGNRISFTMAKLVSCFELVYLISVVLLGTVTAVAELDNQCNPGRQWILCAAENIVLRRFAYAKKNVRSSVICGRECSMDEHCKSINFYECNNLCELNNATRAEYSDDFFEDQGGVYFDEDEDTPLFSLADTDSFLARAASCKKLMGAGYVASGVYTIYPEGFNDKGIQVYCDMETDGGGWIVFQRRQDGTVDFYRDWAEYKSGFGDVCDEFWLGNDNLVDLTSQGTWELRVDLGSWDGNTAWAKYATFIISGQNYTLHIGQYNPSSSAGDSLGYHRYKDFSTKDNDNDGSPSKNCAQKHLGGWWFNNCADAHLNGHYYPDKNPGVDGGLEWYDWRSYYSMKKCAMKMRETEL